MRGTDAAGGSAGAGAELALLLSRPRLDEAGRERVAVLAAAGIDWEPLDALAAGEVLGALWHPRLAGVPGVPAWFLERQRARHRASVAAEARAAADLAAALDALGRAGVAALALKGPVLVKELFGEAAALPSADLDLLVRPEQAAAAVAAFAELGYRPDGVPDAARLRILAEVDLHHPGGRTPLDCHWRLGHPRHFPGPEEHWWRDARTRGFNGVDVPVPGEEQSLLFGALHLFKHGFRGLRQLAVFAAMLEAWDGKVGGARLAAAARAFSADRALRTAVHLAEALLGAAPPRGLAPALRRVGPGGRRFLSRLETEVLRPRLAPGTVRLAVMAWQHGPAGTAARLARWALPPVDEVRLRYGVPPRSPWLWWHYLANPVRLLSRRAG